MSGLPSGRQGRLEHNMEYSKFVVLADLVRELPEAEYTGEMGTIISGISYDSRKVRPGDIFVALKGSAQDGHDYIRDAVARGAVAVVAQRGSDKQVSVPVVRVPDPRRALARLAAVYYDWPQNKLSLVGITGTNGKTTTTYLVESILRQAGLNPAVIGTVNYRYMNMTCPAPVTTPESLDLMRAFRKVVDRGASHAIVEVSSHALAQGRVADCDFKVGVFTNLSRDHLDYHGSMESYFEAKSLLFTNLSKNKGGNPSAAVINADSPYGTKLAELVSVPVTFYGLESPCQVSARNVSVEKGGMKGRLVTPAGEMDFFCPLIGRFNLYNVLAATATSLCLGVSLASVVKGLSHVGRVPGRVEPVNNNLAITVVVDYAHTPDALEKVLRDLRPLTRGRVITVFGCGGDRDKGKRPEMGQIAVSMSDFVVITSDNPRTENPLSIIQDIIEGVTQVTGGAPYIVEPDREKAIQMAIDEAREGDLVLIAGKGHEDYQIIGSEKRHFDDREVAERFLTRNG